MIIMSCVLKSQISEKTLSQLGEIQSLIKRSSIAIILQNINNYYHQQRINYALYVMHIYVLYCIISIHSYSASCNAHQSDALPVRETQREDSTTYIKSMCLYSFIHSGDLYSAS